MRADARKFVEQAMLLFEKAEMNMTSLAKKSHINRTTLYRLFNGETTYIDKDTAHKIAKGLGAEIEFNGPNTRLFLPNLDEKIESFFQDTVSIGANNGRVGTIISEIVKMLKSVDVEVLETAEEFVKLIVSMDKEDIVNVRKLQMVMNREENRELFKEKLRALVLLALPYVKEEEKVGIT